MSSDTTNLPIGKCLLKVIDNRGKTPPLSDVETPHGLIEINALVGQSKHPDYKVIRKFVSAETYGSWFRSGHPEDGDVLFSTVGSIAEVAIVCGGKGCIAQNLIALRANPAIVNSDYFYYALINPEVQVKLRTLDISSVQPSIKVPHLLATEIPLISLSLQKEVVVILSALDDRITLLRETNATLEAIAQALFKSWFVDFDPVRAKLEGRAPAGMDEATAALFPDEFEESELGLVPSGWWVGTLQNLLVLQRGFDLPAQDRVPGDYPIIAASGPSGTHKVAMAKGPGVVTGRSGVLGRVFLELGDYWPLNTALWVKEFRGATPCYAYEVLRLLDFSSFNAGSAVPTLNRNHVHTLPYLIPSRTCVEAYEALAIQLHQRVRLNEKQAQTLATLRDTLLPRLISGQLRLPGLASFEEKAIL